MINKNFFLGVLTTLLVVVILATGGLVAVSAFRTAHDAGFMAGGRPGGFEQWGGDGQFQPGQDNQHFGHRSDGNFNNEDRPITAMPLRGIGGVLGSLFLIGLIVAVVAGGSRLFKRFQGRATPPVKPAASPKEYPVETPATDETPIEPDEPPAGKNS